MSAQNLRERDGELDINRKGSRGKTVARGYVGNAPSVVVLSAAQRRTLWRCVVPEIERCRTNLHRLRDAGQVDSPVAVFLRHELTHLIHIGEQLASPDVVTRSIGRYKNNTEGECK